MAAFKNKAMMEKIFGEILNELIRRTELGRQMKDNGISILYKITDLDMLMYIDGYGAVFGKAAETKTPVITNSMSSDTAHKFWLNKIDLPRALASGQIKARGSATKLLQLLPLLSIVKEIYPEYCRKYNLPLD